MMLLCREIVQAAPHEEDVRYIRSDTLRNKNLFFFGFSPRNDMFFVSGGPDWRGLATPSYIEAKEFFVEVQRANAVS